MSIHLQTFNNNSLRKAFTESLSSLKYSSKRDHHLLILSCYIDFEAIYKLIDSVQSEVRTTKVSLSFEYFEAFRGRQPNETVDELNDLAGWCKEREIEFTWYAIRAGALMHAKGYAVIQSIRGEQGGGVVCIGSGNATLPGLGSNSKPNVELAYISEQSSDITSFLAVWDLLIKKNRSLDKASEQADEYEFSYSLLASGIFLHEWQDNFRSQVGITYTLTTEGKKAISVDEELKQLGFDIDQATINRNPLDTIDFSFSRDLPSGFAKKYTIDSLIGRWCPLSVWTVVEDILEREDNFKKFRDSFFSATKPEKLEKAAQQESLAAERLVKRGVVTDVPDRIERWKAKIENLRENNNKLKRIFLKFYDFNLPYDFSSREEIEELYESLLESLSIKSNRSFIAKKIEEAEEAGDLSLLELTENERLKLEAFLMLKNSDIV